MLSQPSLNKKDNRQHQKSKNINPTQHQKIKQFGKEELQKEALELCKVFDLMLDNNQEPANIAEIFKTIKSDDKIKKFIADINE